MKENRKWTYLLLEAMYHDTYLQNIEIKARRYQNDFTKMGIKKAYLHRQKGLSDLKKGDGLLIYRKSVEEPKSYKSCITSFD